MKNLITIITIALSTLSVNAQMTAERELQKALDESTAIALKEHNVPGMAIAIIKNDQVIIKKGLQVKVITGKDKGKTGEILEIDRKLNKIKVKSINMIKKHLKPTKENKGGIISKESFIHWSNVKNLDENKKIKTIKK